jgi:Tfp pilus assembly protein PilN
VKPVNLLPERHRPRAAGGKLQGSAYVLVSVLGALLLGVVVYVLIGNQISSRQSDTVRVKDEANRAEARAASLGNFENFAQMKQTRETSVKALAATRYDWERSVRELSRVLPSGVWVTSLDATSPGKTSSSSSESSSTASSSSSDPAAAESAKLHVTGCAPSQREVARTLVRLRQLSGATDVKLGESSQAEGTAAGAGATPAPGASGAGAGCGDGYSFDVTVMFEAGSAALGAPAGGAVPAAIGGGS